MASLLSSIILYASNLSALLPIWNGRKQRSLLWVYVWVSFLCDVAGFLAKQFHGPRHLHVNLFLLLEFTLVSWFLCRAILTRSMYSVAASLIGLIGAAFVVSCLCRENPQGNFVGGAMFYGLFILQCIAALRKVMLQIEQIKIEQSALFVFAAAFLLYASGSMVLLLFKVTMDASHKAIMDKIWDLRNVLNVLKNVAIAYIFTIPKTQAFERR